MSTRVYVGNIPYKATEDQLRDFFADVGEVNSVRMIVVPQTGQPKGFAFVEMATDALAKKAITSLNGKPFVGRELRVSEARSNERRNSSGHGGRPGIVDAFRSNPGRF